MSRVKPKFIYDRHRDEFPIYEMEYIGTSSYGNKIDTKYTEEEAKEEVYRLNGWSLNNQNK